MGTGPNSLNEIGETHLFEHFYPERREHIVYREMEKPVFVPEFSYLC